MNTNGPTIIYDKSFIQSLSTEEAKWLHHFFHVVMTEIFLVELVSNLEKTTKTGSSPPELVAIISSKIPSWGFTPNIPYESLIVQNLIGNAFPMDRRPILGGGQRIPDPRGGYGWFFDQSPEADAISRWQQQSFTEIEQTVAKYWRKSTAEIDLTVIRKSLVWFKQIFVNITNEESLFVFVDGLVKDELQRFRTLSMCLDLFNITGHDRRYIIARWNTCNRPTLDRFAPYASFATRVGLFFLFGVAINLIADTRPKHIYDFAYLHYLPFSTLFVSNDKLHRRFAPLFMASDQIFVDGVGLKSSLREIAGYYHDLPDDQKQGGTLQYARYPPLQVKSLISQLYDRCCPGWREDASAPHQDITPEVSARIMKHLKPMMDAIENRERKDRRRKSWLDPE